MDTRYQVFVSSTYTDLQDERAKVQKIIMQLNCIPAGMELFPAIDEEQFNFIKKIIDDSDYYVLIIGGRYGTIADDGLSYTEKEYDYAVSKGIKVIALIHGNPGKLSFDKSEQDVTARAKLEKFRTKATTNRVVLFWNEPNELPAQVALSLPVAIKTYPAVGWVRASNVPNPDIYQDYVSLLKENERLKKEAEKQSAEAAPNLADLTDSVLVEGLVEHSDFMNGDSTENWSINTTWGDIFRLISPRLIIPTSEDAVESYIATGLREMVEPPVVINQNAFGATSRIKLKYNSFEAIRIQFIALNLINLAFREGSLMWHLSPSGEKILIIDKAIRKAV